MSNQTKAQGYEGVLLRLIVIVIVVGVGLFACNALVTAIGNFGPDPVGVIDGNLTPCLASNCLSSLEGRDSEQIIVPLELTDGAMAKLVSSVRRLPNADIREQTETYLFARTGSVWMNGVIDVEVFINEDDNRVDLKFEPRASGTEIDRVRAQVEQLRTRYIQEQP